jgi:transketolase
VNKPEERMRDVFLDQIYAHMRDDERLFFLTADFGSPVLNKIRKDFTKRIVNVGIAEQNLINISTGLALEGYIVYAYAIAPFLTMRAYEQVRNNLSFMADTERMNINLIGVGAGLSYDMSGPSHCALEDICIMRTLPDICIFSPSDCALTKAFFNYSRENKRPKYLRLDAKPLPNIYMNEGRFDIDKGFCALVEGKEVCMVSTGFMTHTALKVAHTLKKEGIRIGLVDVFMIRPVSGSKLFEELRKYRCVVTLEEGFINKGGLDSLIAAILDTHKSGIMLKRMGFGDKYVFDIGSRAYLHTLHGLDDESIVRNIREGLLQK